MLKKSKKNSKKLLTKQKCFDIILLDEVQKNKTESKGEYYDKAESINAFDISLGALQR